VDADFLDVRRDADDPRDARPPRPSAGARAIEQLDVTADWILIAKKMPGRNLIDDRDARRAGFGRSVRASSINGPLPSGELVAMAASLTPARLLKRLRTSSANPRTATSVL
jgi:hypothetical protein